MTTNATFDSGSGGRAATTGGQTTIGGQQQQTTTVVERNEYVENASITKKSALQFFKNVIEENRTDEPAVDGSGRRFNDTEAAATTVVLEPGPPPTFDYVPRTAAAATVKKDQMTERLKRLSTNQRLLSPEQIPSGAVRIFPDVHADGGGGDRRPPETAAEPPAHGPLLRPRADIHVRPGSPRPSAEAVSMEKLWSKSHHQSDHRPSPSAANAASSSSLHETNSSSRSFVSETVETVGGTNSNAIREERRGTVTVDDGVSKVSETFAEISATKHVEPPRNDAVRSAGRPSNAFTGQTSSQHVPAAVIQHVEPPKNDRTLEKQRKLPSPQPEPTVFRASNQTGGRYTDGVQTVTERSFSAERSKAPADYVTDKNADSRSNSIKTMQKMFEQTGSAPGSSRPYSRLKYRASDSDFESEAELSKYNVTERRASENSVGFESSSSYAFNDVRVQEVKSTASTMMMTMTSSPAGVKESGYAADTDEPARTTAFRSGSDQTGSSQQMSFASRRNPGFQGSLIKKVRFDRLLTECAVCESALKKICYSRVPDGRRVVIVCFWFAFLSPPPPRCHPASTNNPI